MAKEVLIPKKWIWDGSCTYSTKYDLLSKYFIEQPATPGTAGQVLALNSDLEPVWQDEGELPAPGTEGQVLALNSSLEPVWQDDKTTTSFDKDDVPNTYDAKGDVYIPDGDMGVAPTQGAVHYLGPIAGDATRAIVITDITADNQMTGLVGIALSTDYTDGILIKGIINVGSAVGTNVGEAIYLTGTGGLSSTVPSGTGEYVRVAGYYLGNNKVYFNPSQDFILLS